jgi:hypothetical protein
MWRGGVGSAALQFLRRPLSSLRAAQRFMSRRLGAFFLPQFSKFSSFGSLLID